MKALLTIFLFVALISCQSKGEINPAYSKDIWLEHKGSYMPIRVEGNVPSKIFLLILHGGPGGSAQSYNLYTPSFSDELEKKYAVAYWDQRNSGASKGDHSDSNSTVEQFVEDTDKAIDLLQNQYGKDIKVFLLGHSWGGYLSMAYTAKHKARVKAQIIINGLTVQDKRPFQLKQVKEIAQMQIDNNQNSEEWKIIQNKMNSIDSTKSLNGVTNITAEAENLIGRTMIQRTENLDHIIEWDARAEKMFPYNKLKLWYTVLDQGSYPLNSLMKNVTTPTGMIISDLDVRVPKYVQLFGFESISTPKSQKDVTILPKSGHSPMNTSPILTAEAVIKYVELWK